MQPLSPLDPRRPLHMLYIYIATFNCPKSILGLGGGGASKIKLKDLNFLFAMTNVSILRIFRAHARKEYRKIEKMKGTYIHNIFCTFTFGNLQRFY